MATLEEVQQAAQTLPDGDLRTLRTWITTTEFPRREAAPQIEQAEAELVAQLQEQHPELAPDYATDVEVAETLEDLFAKLPAWVQPTSKASAYPPMSLVKHSERAYRARRLTDKEPGTPFDGWEDVTAHYLRPELIADGNDPEVDTDAPGLITEPEETTPAPMAQPWKAGEWYSAGELALDNGVAYVSQRLHRATENTRPSTEAKEWRPLPA
ncbi:hypothetical protein [Corynebacterium lujinxingii]|uniref:Chitin-binding type-3 domain-containing protein n=1 Tax=Corynebacterium lujinxingii TaxID=2763010 RepID=A0A7H0K0U3_9CORY|nr:hypothetical protein [Corynebacterium lujinxingii]MBC3179755.1 hypothetical protein [Corynebacterium lujinxingii]NNO10707.1 hypothetical protein [Corynebacterium lujinxingii]QNP90909.1 hypothetical protein IAU68_03855 [Corynebacterium lujinxingii]